MPCAPQSHLDYTKKLGGEIKNQLDDILPYPSQLEPAGSEIRIWQNSIQKLHNDYKDLMAALNAINEPTGGGRKRKTRNRKSRS